MPTSNPKPLVVHFGLPEHGWMDLYVKAESTELRLCFSYVYDSVSVLATALLELVSYPQNTPGILTFMLEPEEYDFVFTPGADGVVTMSVNRFFDHRRTYGAGDHVVSLTMPLKALGLVWWRALRDLRGRISAEDYEKGWRLPFPERAVAELAERLRGRPSRNHGAA